jgi:hypothetical protein
MATYHRTLAGHLLLEERMAEMLILENKLGLAEAGLKRAMEARDVTQLNNRKYEETLSWTTPNLAKLVEMQESEVVAMWRHYVSLTCQRLSDLQDWTLSEGMGDYLLRNCLAREVDGGLEVPVYW